MIHGEVKINDQVIATWQAENTGKKVQGDTAYNCCVEGRDNRGYPYNYRFVVLHAPANGALSLTGAILTKATKYIKG